MLFPDALRTFKKHQSEERLKPFTIDTQISHRFLCLKSPFLRFFFISLPPLPLRKQKLQLLYFRFSFLGYSAVQYLCWKGSIRFRFRYRRYSTKDIWHLPPLPTHLQEDPLSHVRVKSYRKNANQEWCSFIGLSTLDLLNAIITSLKYTKYNSTTFR